MKSYKIFVISFIVLFVLYAIMKITEPKNVQWNLSLRSDDKNPFGTYILYHSLDTLFPDSYIRPFRKPFYNYIDEEYRPEDSSLCVYIAVAPTLNFSKTEAGQLFNFVSEGNYVFLSAEEFQGALFDSLKLKTGQPIISLDSSSVNFANPNLKQAKGFGYKSAEVGFDLLGNYFDSLPEKYSTKILGVVEKNNHPDFVKIEIGKGSLFIHASPIVFTNAFLLSKNNHEYLAKALSYLPPKVEYIYWDNYYTQGNEGASTPFRYMLNNFWLRTGFYLAWILLFLYIFFGGKRRQRIIPVLTPPRNTTYQFISTISNLYFNRNSSNEIARKKILYWKEFVRNEYHCNEIKNDDEFIDTLATKSGTDQTIIKAILQTYADTAGSISNNELMRLFNNIQTFYQQAKA